MDLLSDCEIFFGNRDLYKLFNLNRGASVAEGKSFIYFCVYQSHCLTRCLAAYDYIFQ